MIILYYILILLLIFFLCLLLLALLFLLSGIISIIFGAPYVPVSKNLVQQILSFGNLSKDDIFYDLGCGDGRTLISSIYDFNVSKAVGYEVSPWPYFKALLLIKNAKFKKISLYRKNCLKADIKQATFIYLYLFPELVNKIAYKISKECPPKTKILCVSFPIDVTRHKEFHFLKSTKLKDKIIYLYELKSL